MHIFKNSLASESKHKHTHTKRNRQKKKFSTIMSVNHFKNPAIINHPGLNNMTKKWKLFCWHFYHHASLLSHFDSFSHLFHLFNHIARGFPIPTNTWVSATKSPSFTIPVVTVKLNNSTTAYESNKFHCVSQILRFLRATCKIFSHTKKQQHIINCRY